MWFYAYLLRMKIIALKFISMTYMLKKMQFTVPKCYYHNSFLKFFFFVHLLEIHISKGHK